MTKTAMKKRKQKPKKQKAQKPHPGGRPTSYRPEYAARAGELCLNGAIDRELADEFGVDISTIHHWKVRHPAFLNSIKRNKEIADERVIESLYHRANGYTFDAVRFVGTEGKRFPYREHVPPDVTAQIFWLKNRQPELWRDRHEHIVDSTTVTKTAEELKQEFIAYIVEHDLVEEIARLLPKKALKLIEGIATEGGIANRTVKGP